MHGLAILFHDIVSDIHQIVDGTDSAGCQSTLHPLGGRRNLDIFYHAGDIARAKLLIFHFHADIVLGLFLVTGSGNHRRVERQTESCSSFSCDADDAETVHTVGSYFIFKYGVVKSQCLNGIGTYLHVILKHIDAIFGSLRIKVSGTSQLLNGTHHAVAGHTTEFSGFNLDAFLRHGTAVMSSCNHTSVQNNGNFLSHFHVGGTGYNLDSLCTDVPLTYHQFVCVGVFLDGLNLSYYDFI